MVGAAEAGGHRAHRWIAAAVVAVVGAPRQRIARLHGDRRMVAGRAVDGANNRQLVHQLRLQRQMLADLDAGHAGRHRLVRSANLLRRQRFRIPHVDVTGSAGEPDQYHGSLVGRRRAGGCGGGLQRLVEGNAGQSGRPKPQEPATRTDPHHVPVARQKCRSHRALHVVDGVRIRCLGLKHYCALRNGPDMSCKTVESATHQRPLIDRLSRIKSRELPVPACPRPTPTRSASFDVLHSTPASLPRW